MDKETLALWNRFHKGSKSPLRVGDIVKMKPDINGKNPNRGRLMRITKVMRELSHTGYTVIVKVNAKDKRPIFDIDGKPCCSLQGYDCAWFTLVERNG